MLNLFNQFNLFETELEFCLQPRDKTSGYLRSLDEALVINRYTASVTVARPFTRPSNAKESIVKGLFGIKQLIENSYLIVIKDASEVGEPFSEHVIYRVERTEIIPFKPINNDDRNTSKADSDWEAIYLGMLRSMLDTSHFYFSYTYDLTNSMQRNLGALDSRQLKLFMGMKASTQNYQGYDRRFLWNENLLLSLMVDRDDCDFTRYRIPIILGFISINDTVLHSVYVYTLISRRATRRAGTRFTSRGIDHEGNVSNFVETEQIVDSRGVVMSHVQIRGSIPLFWSQTPDYKYKPAIKIHQIDHSYATKKHFEELTQTYGNVSVVSLIDQSGHEGSLAREFNQHMQSTNIPYHYFDFHKECSRMRWHKLSILMERIEKDISSNGFFAFDFVGIRSHQTGVIRSNCIDSLDRTNVIQSMIALRVLQKQVEKHQNVTDGLSFTATHGYSRFVDLFNNVWADNADALSKQYAGTPALKTDFTRTGRRTHMGVLNDGLNSLSRYVTNNFLDNYRQDAIDLFLGNYHGYPSPLYRPSAVASYTSTVPVTVVMFMLIVLYLYYRW